MSNMQERLEASVVQAEINVSKLYQIVHGDTETIIETDNGPVSSLSKQMKDVRDEITGGVSDVVAEAESARDDAIKAKHDTLDTETRIVDYKKEVEELKSDTNTIKTSALSEIEELSNQKLLLATEQVKKAEYFANNTEIRDLNIYQSIENVLGANIVLSDTQTIYRVDINENTILTVDASALIKPDKVITFELIINLINVSTITFPQNTSWLDNISPNLSTVSKYLFVFRSFDNGANWVANLQGTL